MAKCKRGCGARWHAWCKCNPKMPHMLLALVVALGVLVLTPSVGGNYSTSSVMSGFLVTEDDGSSNTDADTDGSAGDGVVDNPADDNGAVDDGVINDGPDDNDSGTGDMPNDGWNSNDEPDNTGTPDWSCEPGTSCVDDEGNKWHTDPNGNTTPDNNYDNDNSNNDGWIDNNNWDDGNNDNGDWNNNDNGDWGSDGGGGWNDWQEGNPSDQDCKNDVRDAKRIQRELKQLIKKAENPAELESLASEVEQIQNALESCSSLTWEQLNEYRERLHGENSIQMQLDKHRMIREKERMEKEREKQQRHFEQEKNFLNEMCEQSTEACEYTDQMLEYMERIPELQAELISLMEEMMNASDQIEMEDIRWEMDDLWAELDDTYYGMDELRMYLDDMEKTVFIKKDLDKIEENLTFFLENEYPNLPESTKEKAYELAQAGLKLVAKAREADDYELDEIFQKLDELRIKAERLMGKMKTGFNEMGFDEQFDNKFETSVENMPYKKQLELVKRILNANPDILQQIFEGDELLAERTMRIFDKVPEEAQGGLLEAKASLGELYEEVSEENPSIDTYKEDILGYNYVGDSLDELVSNMQEVSTGSMTISELVTELPELKEKAKQEKKDWGVVSFTDYDDDAWYYYDVEDMYEEGVVNGMGDGTFAPGNNVSRAEALKMVLEKFDEGQSNSTPAMGEAKNHWAKGYIAKAEELGVEINGSLDGPASRGEIAKWIVQVTNVEIVNPSTSSFSDLSTSDQYYTYLETMKEYDVFGGDSSTSGLPTIRSNDPINRAEVAKVINYADTNIITDDVLKSFTEISESYEYEEDNNGGIKDDGNVEDTSDELFDLMDNLMNNVMGAFRTTD